MSLLDLPLEIFRLIIEEAVILRDLRRALRLRVVCKLFGLEAKKAIYASHMLDSCRVSKENCPLYRSYLEYRVLEDRSENFPLLVVIRKIANRLCLEDSLDAAKSSNSNYKKYVSQLCALTSRRSDYELRQYFSRSKRKNDDEELIYDLIVAAAYTNKLSIIEALVSEGYGAVERPSLLFGSSTYAAVKAGNLDILGFLLKDSTDFMVTVYPTLRLAARCGQVEIVKFLLDAHWGPWRFDDETKYIEKTIRAGMNTPSLEIFEIVMKLSPTTLPPIPPFEQYSLLKGAARNGWIEMVRHLLLLGVPPSAPDNLWSPMNPLYYACTGGHSSTVRLLLDHGSPTNGSELLAACTSGHEDIVRLLLERGFRSRNTVSTAVKNGNLRAVKVLLEFNMDIDEGLPAPVVGAVMREDTAMFCMLVEKGAVLNTRRTGVEAMKRAKAAGSDSMVSLLKQYGIPEPIKSEEPEGNSRRFSPAVMV